MMEEFKNYEYPPNADYYFEYIYVYRLVLITGEIIEEVAWLSKKGKSYIVDYPDERGIRSGKTSDILGSSKRQIPVGDIVEATKIKRQGRILHKC